MRREQIIGGGEYNEPSRVEQGELERKQVLEVAIRAFEDFTRKAAQEDRPITVETRYYLQGILRNGTPSLQEAAQTLRDRAAQSNISLALQAMLSDTARRCVAADRLVSSATHAVEEGDEDPSTGPASLALHGGVMKQKGLIGPQGEAVPPKESVRVVFSNEEERRVALGARDILERDAARERLHVRWERSFQIARSAARRFVQGHPDFRRSLDETRDALRRHEESLPHQWDIDPAVVGAEFTEAFFAAYIVALAEAREESHSLDSALQDIIGLRCRVAEMEDAARAQETSEIIPEDPALEVPTLPGGFDQPEAPSVPAEIQPVFDQTPEERLGIAFDASAEDVEAAFAQAMQGLDFESDADRQRIVAIQGARERLLQRAEQRGRDAERLRKLREALGPASGAPREIVLDTPPTIEAPERWLSKQLRSPGARIRAALFGGASAVIAGAAGLALHEFGETESEPSRIVAGALEDPKIDDGSSESFGVDLEDDKNTEGPGPEMAAHVEAPTSDHVVADRETLWKVLKDKIQDRGLRVTNEKIVTLKHFADLENPTVDWDHLQVGQVIHLASVESMLDEMEGKPASSATLRHPVYGISSSVEHQPHDVSQSIAQQRAEDSPSWIAGSIMPGHETVAAKAYEDIPREGNTRHAMARGEWIYKLIHLMLRDSGLNWSTPRITKLKNMTLQENGLSEEQAKKIPVGAIITFDSAVREIQAMKAAKEKGKKK